MARHGRAGEGTKGEPIPDPVYIYIIYNIYIHISWRDTAGFGFSSEGHTIYIHNIYIIYNDIYIVYNVYTYIMAGHGGIRLQP
jgi:hypothetical protein